MSFRTSHAKMVPSHAKMDKSGRRLRFETAFAKKRRDKAHQELRSCADAQMHFLGDLWDCLTRFNYMCSDCSSDFVVKLFVVDICSCIAILLFFCTLYILLLVNPPAFSLTGLTSLQSIPDFHICSLEYYLPPLRLLLLLLLTMIYALALSL